MNGLLDMFKSEKGVGFLLILVAATVFVAMGKMTVSTWQLTVLPLYGGYAVTHTAASMARTKWDAVAVAGSDTADTPAESPKASGD